MKKLISISMMLAVLGCSLPAAAAVKDVKLPPFKEHTLENGLRVFVMETREVPLVTVRLIVPTGSTSDPTGGEGLASITADLIMKGAGGLSAEEISETVESAGGSLEAYAGRDYTLVYGDFLSRDLTLALDMIGKVMLTPDFPADEIAREKSIVSAQIQSTKERPYSLASREFVSRLLGDHPYAHPIAGFAGTVETLDRGDITAFHKRYYVPRGSILAIVGNVKSKDAMKLVKKHLGGWKGGSAEPADIPELSFSRFPSRKVIVIDKPDLTQSQIRIGNIAAPMNTPDYFPLIVANNILGGGFTSRLMDEIRVNRGLSYGARSYFSRYRLGGYFGVVTYTKNETLREAIDVALEQLRKMREEKVETDELEGSKRYMSGLFPFDLETNADLAQWLTTLAFYGLDRGMVEEYRSRVARITADDVQRVANEYMHLDDCRLVLLTNYEATREQLEGLGDIEVIGIDEIE